MDNQHYLLACNRISGIGPRTLVKCLKRWPDLSELFRASPTELTHVGLSEASIHGVRQFDFRVLEDDLRWAQQENAHLLTWESPHYPTLLLEINDPPPVLYALGDLSCLSQTTLAIVGTRYPTPLGQKTAWRFAHDLAATNITIVSGLALGVDAQAHQGCIHANGKTVAVMGTGIDIIYPRQHGFLADKIVKNGLLLTEFPLNSQPKAGHFPRRNRIISGLAKATLVIEANIRSGSLITARFAMEYNRDVFAVPGSIHLAQACGCHQLLQQGALLVTSSHDVKEAMGVEVSVQPSSKNIPIPLQVCENETVLRCIGFETTTVDQIIDRSGLCLNNVLCVIAELEIQGCIQIVPGGYMRCRE